MISASLLPKAMISIGAGSALLTSRERESRFIPLLVVGRAFCVIGFLTHGTELCAVVFDNIRKFVQFLLK